MQSTSPSSDSPTSPQAASPISPSSIPPHSFRERVLFLLQEGYLALLLGSIAAFLFAGASIYIALERSKVTSPIKISFVLDELDKMSRATFELQDQILRTRSEVRTEREEVIERFNVMDQITRSIFFQIQDIRSRLRSAAPIASNEPDTILQVADHLNSLVSLARAQAQQPVAPTQRFSQEDAKVYIMVFVFCVLGVTFFTSMSAVFMTTSPDILKFAFDTIKTLLGFFIGVATAFLGIPTPPS